MSIQYPTIIRFKNSTCTHTHTGRLNVVPFTCSAAPLKNCVYSYTKVENSEIIKNNNNKNNLDEQDQPSETNKKP